MQINLRTNDDKTTIIDTFIKEKREKTGIVITRNALINAAINKLIDISNQKNLSMDQGFVNFDNYLYDFLNFPESKILIESLVHSKAELVVMEFKKANYLAEKGLTTSAILALPGIVEEHNNEYRVSEKLLLLALHQIIDLNNDIDGPKNLIFQEAFSILMAEPQNGNKENGYYYFI